MKSCQTNIKTYKEEYDRYIQKVYEAFGVLYHKEHPKEIAVWERGLDYSFESSDLPQEQINQLNKDIALRYLDKNLMIYKKWIKKYKS